VLWWQIRADNPTHIAIAISNGCRSWVLDPHIRSVFIIVARYHIFGLVQTCIYLPVILSFESYSSVKVDRKSVPLRTWRRLQVLMTMNLVLNHYLHIQVRYWVNKVNDFGNYNDWKLVTELNWCARTKLCRRSRVAQETFSRRIPWFYFRKPINTKLLSRKICFCLD